MFVTTSQKGETLYEKEAKELAISLGVPFYKRNGLSVKKLCERYNVETFMQWDSNGPTICCKSGKSHSFNLGMAQLRIKRLKKGQHDNFALALGDDSKSLLDCTLGFGADSLVASYYWGDGSKVVGVEGYLPLAYTTNYGFRHFKHNDESVNKAFRRIQVVGAKYQDVLDSLADNSFDIVYFDPMFTHGVDESSQFQGMRERLIYDALSLECFEKACKIARKKVIVKERNFSPIFEKLGITEKVGGKYSRVIYGIYYV